MWTGDCTSDSHQTGKIVNQRLHRSWNHLPLLLRWYWLVTGSSYTKTSWMKGSAARIEESMRFHFNLSKYSQIPKQRRSVAWNAVKHQGGHLVLPRTTNTGCITNSPKPGFFFPWPTSSDGFSGLCSWGSPLSRLHNGQLSLEGNKYSFLATLDYIHRPECSRKDWKPGSILPN